MALVRLICAGIALSLFLGCGARSQQAESAAASSGEDELNYAVMDVFYGTDRKQSDPGGEQAVFTSERGELTFGVTQVSIPRDHRMGELESPSIWRFEFRENPEKHVVLLNTQIFDKSSFFNEVAEDVGDSNRKSAFVFVHGYNVTFENAARRTAQMSYDLGFDGAAVFYSWPSHGEVAKYPFDEANVQWSKPNLEKFLSDFADESTAEKIFLIAHSMGNRALLNAYVSLVQARPDLKERFSEVILAAPDIDAAVFKRDIAPAMVASGAPVTLYASSEDVALKASRNYHGGYPRAGESGDDLLILPGIESIDSTSVKSDFLGHSYYADEKSVLSDMFYILNNGLRASQRAGLDEITSDNGTHWRFKR